MWFKKLLIKEGNTFDLGQLDIFGVHLSIAFCVLEEIPRRLPCRMICQEEQGLLNCDSAAQNIHDSEQTLELFFTEIFFIRTMRIIIPTRGLLICLEKNACKKVSIAYVPINSMVIKHSPCLHETTMLRVQGRR